MCNKQFQSLMRNKIHSQKSYITSIVVVLLKTRDVCMPTKQRRLNAKAKLRTAIKNSHNKYTTGKLRIKGKLLFFGCRNKAYQKLEM